MTPTRFLPNRTALVSPHLDDGVLSLGAAISRATRSHAHVRVVTVFGGDVDSVRPASGWDSLAGFATEGEAMQTRREEDAEACGIVGAEHVHLAFSEPVYAGPPREQDVFSAVRRAVQGVDAVLLPGFPLIHRDHRWVSEHFLRQGLDCDVIGLYAEQPYRYERAFRRVSVGLPLRALLSEDPSWRGARTGRYEFRVKQRAISAYGTQLKWLHLEGSKLVRLLVSEVIRGGEAVAWITPRRRAA